MFHEALMVCKTLSDERGKEGRLRGFSVTDEPKILFCSSEECGHLTP